MRKFETSVQELKHEVLKEVAQLAWEDRLTTGVLDIPQNVIPGPEARGSLALMARPIITIGEGVWEM